MLALQGLALNPGSTSSSCLNLDKLLTLNEPQFPYLKMWIIVVFTPLSGCVD